MAMTSSMEVEEREATNISIPQQWSQAADTIASGGAHTPTIFICGPKNSGKSTFSRHLFHILLHRHKKAAYLDTDVGQPEFTPPGYLKSQPETCFFFGDISSKRDPEIYLKYIFALYNHYLKHYHQNLTNTSSNNTGVPLLINTPGWVKGIVRGVDTLRDVVYIMSPVPQHILEDVDVLLQGFIQIPTCLLQVQGCVSNLKYGFSNFIKSPTGNSRVLTIQRICSLSENTSVGRKIYLVKRV
ncbi:hypothetical protein L1887_37378 [Cichorium endivia]|nr:hypothetical protein L1887_37378 [Cichorium endivia]